MNLKNILREIEQADTAAYEKPSDRREVLKGFGSKLAAASLPLAISSLFNNKAYAKTTSASAVVSSLNFMLQLEYFQYNFYHTANNTGSNTTGTLIPSADQAGFLTIENQQKAHINFLNTTITGLNGTPYTPPNYNPSALNPYYVVSGAYDFTGGGVYSTVFSDYNMFLILAAVFEDTVVHGYKGQIPTLLGNIPLLTQIMEMQCTEARHAAHVRLIRRFTNAPENPAPWITNNIPPTITLQPFYNYEDNVGQSGIDIAQLADKYAPGGTVPTTAATAAFDEAMDIPTVLTLLKPYFL